MLLRDRLKLWRFADLEGSIHSPDENGAVGAGNAPAVQMNLLSCGIGMRPKGRIFGNLVALLSDKVRKISNAELKRRLRLGCVIVLVAGLCSAMLIYLLAEDIPDDSLGYVVVNGTVYPLATRDSKKYRREIQRFGGKTALLFDDFGRWFTELWQGKTLGKTVAWISILVALGLYLFANSLAPDPRSGGEDARDRPG